MGPMFAPHGAFPSEIVLVVVVLAVLVYLWVVRRVTAPEDRRAERRRDSLSYSPGPG